MADAIAGSSREEDVVSDLIEMLPVQEWPPPGAVLVCEFVVVGEAKPAGSKTGGVIYRKDKATGKAVPVTVPRADGKGERIVTSMRDSSGAPGKAWRQDVAAAGLSARSFDAPLTGRLAAEFVFVVPWKDGDYGKRDGRLKGSVLAAPNKRPDALKLARAVEDALTTVLWEDDARITEERIRKVHVPPSRGPRRCEVRLWALPTTIGELRESGMPAPGDDEAALAEPQQPLVAAPVC